MKNAISIIVNYVEKFVYIVSCFLLAVGYIFDLIDLPKIDNFLSKFGISNGVIFYGTICVIALVLAAIIRVIKIKWLSQSIKV